MEPIIDHIQITVKDMSIAVPFYDKLLPLLGFDIQKKVSAVIAEHELHVVEYYHPRLIFPSPHREYPEYTPPGYYALFFKDLEGVKYEIVCTKHNGA